MTKNQAAKKIQKAFRKYKGRKAALTKKQQSAVAAIAKKTVFKQAETKSYIAYRNMAPFDSAYAVLRLNWPIANGTGDVAIIGEKMHLTNIRFRCNIYKTNLTNNVTRLCRLLVIRSKQNLGSGTSPTVITTTDVMRNPTNSKVTLDHVDLHKVDLLYDKTLTIDKNVETGINLQRPFEFNIPINRDEYLDPSTGNLKHGDYYIVYASYDGSLTSSPTGFDFTYALNFKDL